MSFQQKPKDTKDCRLGNDTFLSFYEGNGAFQDTLFTNRDQPKPRGELDPQSRKRTRKGVMYGGLMAVCVCRY